MKGYFELMDGLFKFFTFPFANPKNLALTLLTCFFYLPTLPSLVPQFQFCLEKNVCVEKASSTLNCLRPEFLLIRIFYII